MNQLFKPSQRDNVRIDGLSDRLAPYFDDQPASEALYNEGHDHVPEIVVTRDIPESATYNEPLIDEPLVLPVINRKPKTPGALTHLYTSTSAFAAIAKKKKQDLADSLSYLNAHKAELAAAALAHANKNKKEIATGFAVSASVSLATRLTVTGLATAAGASVGLSAILAAAATGAVMGAVKYERSRSRQLADFLATGPEEGIGSPIAPRWSKEYNRGLRNSILKSTVFSMGGGILGAGFVSAMNHLTGGSASAFVIEKSGWLFDKLKAMGANLSDHVKTIGTQLSDAAFPKEVLPVVDHAPDTSAIAAILKTPKLEQITNVPYQTKLLPGNVEPLKTGAFTPLPKAAVSVPDSVPAIHHDAIVPPAEVKADVATVEKPKIVAAAPVQAAVTPEVSIADKTKALFDGKKLSKRMGALVAHAVDGNPQSQKDLAVKLLYGHGVAKNPAAAVELYKAAAAQGNVQAKVDLLYLKHYGLAGVEADPKGTITEMRELARVNSHAKELLNDWTAKPKLTAVHRDAIEVRDLPPARVRPETADEIRIIPKPEPRPVVLETSSNDPMNSCKWKFNAKGQPISATGCTDEALAKMLKSGNTVDVSFRPAMN